MSEIEQRMAAMEQRIAELEAQLRVSPKGSTAMTEDWHPKAGLIGKMQEELGINGYDELNQFRDYWISIGKQRKDWDAAFRIWCRKSVLYAARDAAKAANCSGRRKDTASTAQGNIDKGTAALDLLSPLNPPAGFAR